MQPTFSFNFKSTWCLQSSRVSIEISNLHILQKYEGLTTKERKTQYFLKVFWVSQQYFWVYLITMRISMSFTNRPCMCPSHKRNIPVHWIDLLFRMLVVNSTTITFYSKPKLIWKILFVSLLFLIFFKKWFCTLILPQTTHWDKTHFFV